MLRDHNFTEYKCYKFM